jgi:hypothetical protein
MVDSFFGNARLGVPRNRSEEPGSAKGSAANSLKYVVDKSTRAWHNWPLVEGAC